LEQFLRDLVATNPKTGADAEAVIRSKTKDKVLLLDSASAAFSAEDVRAAQAKRVASGGADGNGSRGGGRGYARRMSASQKRRRGFYVVPEDMRRWEVFLPLHKLWLGYVTGLLEGCGSKGGGSGGGGGGGLSEGSAAAAAAWAQAERRLEGVDLHGAEVRVDACSSPSRVGVNGIVVRDTARTLQLISKSGPGGRDAMVAVPKRGALFSLEVPFGCVGRIAEGDSTGVERGPGDGSRRRLLLRGDDLARGQR
jgi:RNase P/RNase MRP subunit p29